jgi:hypothetical protein
MLKTAVFANYSLGRLRRIKLFRDIVGVCGPSQPY